MDTDDVAELLGYRAKEIRIMVGAGRSPTIGTRQASVAVRPGRADRSAAVGGQGETRSWVTACRLGWVAIPANAPTSKIELVVSLLVWLTHEGKKRP